MWNSRMADIIPIDAFPSEIAVAIDSYRVLATHGNLLLAWECY